MPRSRAQYYSKPIYRIYILFFKNNAKFIQNAEFISVEEGGRLPELEFVIEKEYIRNSMI